MRLIDALRLIGKTDGRETLGPQFPICRSETAARFAVDVTIDRRDALRRMAEDYGATPRQALDDLLTFTLDDDAAIARRTLADDEKGDDAAALRGGAGKGRNRP